MKKTNKGITLIALIITIVILLILAVVTIRAVQGDGIIAKALKAKTDYQGAQNEEDNTLAGYLDIMNGISEGTSTGGSATLLKEQKDSMLSKTTNTTAYDAYGNKIVIPAGFKILVDGTTGYTANDINVTKGIVIQDTEGNEFVWIPVGTIYTDTEKTASKAITIELNRYTFADGKNDKDDARNVLEKGTPIKQGDAIINDYYQELSTSNRGNAVAKDINAFKTSVGNNGGYYIGRFEAGKTSEGKLVCKSGAKVWNNVAQPTASNLSKGMYTNKPFTSDLINSYAWDTAIVFIQTFGDEDYSRVYGSSAFSKTAPTGTNKLRETGEVDKQLNIYDMAGNCSEWSTETSSYTERPYSFDPCVCRGGFSTGWHVFSRVFYPAKGTTVDAFSRVSFRPLLYV